MRLLLLSVILPLLSLAQSFEVATIKLSARGERGPELDRIPDGRNPQDRYTAKGVYVSELLGIASGIVDAQQISGPGWIRSETYEVTAKFPPATTTEQFQKMLLNLVVERFKLKVHHETKDFPAYELVVMKSGHKLQPPGAVAPLAADGTPFPDLPADKPGFRFNGARLVVRQRSVGDVISAVRPVAGRAVYDKTGLTGVYDYWLEFDPRAAFGGNPNNLTTDVFTALQRQLGLQLVDSKATLDVIVVESGDKVPIEN